MAAPTIILSKPVVMSTTANPSTNDNVAGEGTLQLLELASSTSTTVDATSKAGVDDNDVAAGAAGPDCDGQYGGRECDAVMSETDMDEVLSAASGFFQTSLDKALGLSRDEVDGNNNNNNENRSIGSSSESTIRYFEPSDFLTQNWELLEFDRDYIPSVSLAMVAGGIACFHPLVFVAGVLTAFGTLQAAGAAHNWCHGTDNNHNKASSTNAAGVCYCFPNMAVAQVATEMHEETDQVAVDGGERQRLEADVAHENETEETNEEKVLPYRQISQITFSDDSVLNPPIVTEIKEESMPLSPQSTTPAMPLQSLHTAKSTATHIDTKSALEWVQEYYPPLSELSSVDRVEFYGLNAKEFFEVFFADDAPFGFETFHKIRKDKAVEYGQWETLEQVQKPCLLSSAPTIFAPSSSTASMPPLQERVVKYDAKTNSMFGPAFAPTTKVQRALQVSKRLLVLEIKTTLADVPFSNRFYLMERWLVTSESVSNADNHNMNHSKKLSKKKKQKHQQHSHAHSSKSASCAYLTVTSQVFFTQSCPFESTVHKESSKTINEICTQWNKMAQEALKLTEETRRQRIQEERMENLHDDESDDDAEESEVETSDGDQTVPTSPPPRSEESVVVFCQLDESVEIENVGRRRSWGPSEECLPVENEESNTKMCQSDLVTSTRRAKFQRQRTSSSGDSERKPPHRRLSKSLSKLFRRPAGSTQAAVETTELSASSSPILEYHGLALDDCAS